MQKLKLLTLSYLLIHSVTIFAQTAENPPVEQAPAAAASSAQSTDAKEKVEIIDPAKAHLLKEGSYLTFALPYINKDYFALEYGFIVNKQLKEIKYDYNAYVTATIIEDRNDQEGDLKAGALGFKAGAFFPIVRKFPTFLRVGIGYAKTTLHKNPIFGKNEQAAAKKDMILGELGVLFKYNRYLLNVTYQHGNVKYFNRHLIIALGVNY